MIKKGENRKILYPEYREYVSSVLDLIINLF